ncbi:hypothetical protein QE370_002292 [Aeromicrobium sp. SORGH_AS981]|uniref:protein kinase domain-containing protein n=1 Tax=Aeromicrobium sp. SORGH_AS_0981 TaxID=3041802 RepID=UPI00285CBE00|nr:protein kinase [Aeromicrobium sp. SORGH_AS_0981]MDR6119108.1 hypothetical protein [Aeromicrobium sp. SORGH_AS_0981]
MAERLNDRYELGDLLGAGGMGRVHRARDLRLNRDVAVKILKGDQVGDDAAARARFEEEGRTAGRLHHPGIATIYDVGEDASSEDGDPFIVMQLVEGTAVSEVLKQRGTLAPDAVERLLGGVADALAAAHAADIVHRDVKPANIVLAEGSRPVLVDFGIAIGVSREPLTQTGNVLGTVDYISPEQARGVTATGASDVYSLGLVAYQCLTGTSPFRRETSVATALAQVGEELPPLPDGVPEPLRRLVVAMTDKDPLKRPTAAQVRDAVQGRTDGVTEVLPAYAGATTAPMGALGATGATASTSVLAPVAATAAMQTAPEDPRRRRRGMAIFAGVAALAVLALLLSMSGGLFGSSDHEVPDVVGQSVASATDKIEAVDATVKTETVDEPNAKEGEVVGQSPKAGAAVPTSGPVTLQVASGRVMVPADLVGQPADEVAATLGDLGLTVKRTDVESSQTAGTVVFVDPTGRVTVGSTVTIAVAVAPVVQQTQPTQQQPQQPQQQDQGNDKKDEKNQDKNDKGPGNGGPGGKDDKKP